MQKRVSLIVALGVLWLVVGCDRIAVGMSDAGTPADTGAVGGDAAITDGEAQDAAAEDCQERILALSSELYAGSDAFTVVVRLDYLTLDLLGWQVIHGGYQTLSEQEARDRALIYTTWGSQCQMLNDPHPEDVWVCYAPPGDMGGIGVLSAVTGEPVLGATVIWMGIGEITHPNQWRDPAALGSGCSGTEPFAHTSTFLEGGENLDEVIDAMRYTALFGAVWHGGTLFNLAILRYCTIGDYFVPNETEWIVMVNGGWLE